MMRIRALVSILALAAAVVLTGCTTVPETGRRQILLVSSDQEAQMGLTAFTQIKETEKISTDPVANDRVKRVGQRIAESVGRALPNAQWEFVVFDSEQVNAFALPGGKVGVYTGLLQLAETDDELAAVMGHEIAHVSSRHSGERYSQQLIAAGLNVVADQGMQMAEVDAQKRQLAMTAFAGGTQLGLLKFSRIHESEADSIGLRFAAGAGYDPTAAIHFWERMQKANEGQARPPEFFSTHPSDATRIANLKQLAPQYRELYRQAKAKYDAIELNGPLGSGADRAIGGP